MVTRDLVLPDFSDRNSMSQFIDDLDAHKDRRGVKALDNYCRQALRHYNLWQRDVNNAQRALVVANGQRTPLQARKDNERSLRAAGIAFFSHLSLFELVTYAGRIGVELEPQWGETDVIKALVEDYVKMKEKR